MAILLRQFDHSAHTAPLRPPPRSSVVPWRFNHTLQRFNHPPHGAIVAGGNQNNLFCICTFIIHFSRKQKLNKRKVRHAQDYFITRRHPFELFLFQKCFVRESNPRPQDNFGVGVKTVWPSLAPTPTPAQVFAARIKYINYLNFSEFLTNH